MRSHIIQTAIAVALVTAASTSGQQPNPKKPPAKHIPAEVREAWEVAGFKLEWKKNPGGDRPFVGDVEAEDFPVFVPAERPRVRFAKLPAPDVPFGVNLCWGGWRVDDATLKELAAMKNLHFLDASLGWSVGVSDEWLKSLAGVAELRSLHLGVSLTPVTGGGIKELAALKELRELRIGGEGPDNRAAALEGKGELSGLKALRSLTLWSIPTTDAAFKELGSLGELRRLKLRQVRVTNVSLAELGKLPKLQSLQIEGANPFTKDVTAEGLKALAGAPELRVLFLSNFPMTDEGVKQIGAMKGLRVLSLYNTPVSDDGLKRLAALNGLEYLVLSNRNSRITPAGLKHLAALKELRHLSLRYATVGDEGAKAIGGMKKLRNLYVGATWLTNDSLKHIANLKDLERLDIMANSALTVEAFEPLTRMTKLKTLQVAGTKMYGTPERDRHLASLRKALPNCEISTEGGYLFPGRSTPPR